MPKNTLGKKLSQQQAVSGSIQNEVTSGIFSPGIVTNNKKYT